MKKGADLYIVCKYDRWCAYWFKELLNYVLTHNEAGKVKAYSSRSKSMSILSGENSFDIEFMCQSQVDRYGNRIFESSEKCVVINWSDGEIEKLYSKVKEAIENDTNN